MSIMPPFIGIDFGTSRSAMSWYNPETGQAEIIRNFEGRDETPSVVYLGEGENEIVVGELAERKLREDAERQKFHEPVTRAVITYPASFGPLQQDKIKQAATLAGFSEVELLSEPVAAALAYGYTGLKVGNYILVYDFGGGTFDVAVLARVAERSFTWAAEPKGLEACGGDDLDRELYDYCEEIAHQVLNRGISPNDDIDLRFLFQCRERKENLSAFTEENFSSYLLSNTSPVLFQYTLKRETFEQRIKKYVDQTVSLTQEVMKDAEANRSKVDTVVLIGGSSRVPIVPRSLSSTLSVQPQEWDQRDFAVALGAAYHGIQIWPTELRTHRGTEVPPSPHEAYLQAVRRAWEPMHKLTQAQVNQLYSLANRLDLSPDVAKNIEQETMSHSKEEILIQQRFADFAEYSAAVARSWLDKFLTSAMINDLAAQVNRLGLSKDEVTIIEREIMGDTKERIDERQRHQWALSEYRSAVKSIWEPNGLLAKAQVAELAAQANRFGLSRDEVAAIERHVMSNTKEVIWEHQRHQNALTEYRAIVRRVWESNRLLTKVQVAELAVHMVRLGLSREEGAIIEREIMGKEIVERGLFSNVRSWGRKL